MTPICYVCNHIITGNPVYIGGSAVGIERYRHQRCAPGTVRWMEAQTALPQELRSELYEFFLLGGNSNEV